MENIRCVFSPIFRPQVWRIPINRQERLGGFQGLALFRGSTGGGHARRRANADAQGWSWWNRLFSMELKGKIYKAPMFNFKTNPFFFIAGECRFFLSIFPMIWVVLFWLLVICAQCFFSYCFFSHDLIVKGELFRFLKTGVGWVFNFNQ